MKKKELSIEEQIRLIQLILYNNDNYPEIVYTKLKTEKED